MKNVLILLALMFSVSNAFAQKALESTTGVILSPFATATRIMETATVMSLSPLATTIATLNSLGIAGREQVRDDLVALNDDMVSGRVTSIEEVRQPTLKELFGDIATDEKQMKDISFVVQEGTELEQISTAVTLTLLSE